MFSSKEIEKNLHKLTPRERTVVIYRLGLQGKPKLRDEEIAELIRSPGINTNSVRSLVASAMQKLTRAKPISPSVFPGK